MFSCVALVLAGTPSTDLSVVASSCSKLLPLSVTMRSVKRCWTMPDSLALWTSEDASRADDSMLSPALQDEHTQARRCDWIMPRVMAVDI